MDGPRLEITITFIMRQLDPCEVIIQLFMSKGPKMGRFWESESSTTGNRINWREFIHALYYILKVKAVEVA